MQYAIVIEHEKGSNYSAYVSDLPGCVSTGETLEEVQRNIGEAIDLHLRGMREDGDAIPEPSTHVAYADVA
jgi:predicted RNase H-like HicB family nuclease